MPHWVLYLCWLFESVPSICIYYTIAKVLQHRKKGPFLFWYLYICILGRLDVKIRTRAHTYIYTFESTDKKRESHRHTNTYVYLLFTLFTFIANNNNNSSRQHIHWWIPIINTLANRMKWIPPAGIQNVKCAQGASPFHLSIQFNLRK